MDRTTPTPARLAARRSYSQSSNRIFATAHKRSKLTPLQREEISRRYREGEKALALAIEYKVTTSYIYQLASR